MEKHLAQLKNYLSKDCQWQNNLFKILNIPQSVITIESQNIYNLLDQLRDNDSKCYTNDILTMNSIIRIFDKFHSYFHFEQSFAELLCAYIFSLNDSRETADIYLKKAIFQDPLNYLATSLLNNSQKYLQHSPIDFLQRYAKHYIYEQEFLKFALIKFQPIPEIQLLDYSINCLISGNHHAHIDLITNLSYPSHRLNNALAITYLMFHDLKNAEIQAMSSVAKIQENHLKYHKLAQHFYLKRAILFEKNGSIDLAKNDMIRAANFA